jgi:hypothetical protein
MPSSRIVTYPGVGILTKNKSYHFVTRLNAGYFYSDLEEDMFKEIPNTAFLSPEVGFAYDFRKLPFH